MFIIILMAVFVFVDTELRALVVFDREEKKSYQVPIMITDSGVPTMTGTSTLNVIIGDQNDNAMRSGQSSIFVYNYKVQLWHFHLQMCATVGV